MMALGVLLTMIIPPLTSFFGDRSAEERWLVDPGRFNDCTAASRGAVNRAEPDTAGKPAAASGEHDR